MPKNGVHDDYFFFISLFILKNNTML